VADYFTPYNQASLSAGDTDLGSGGPLLLPDSVGSAAHPHLIVGAGKEGKIYLVDRDNMGHFQAGNDSQIVQELPGAIGGVWSAPAYWNNRVYYNGNGDKLKAFLLTNGLFVATPESQSATGIGFPGATPTISANGTNNGIAWVIDAGAYLSSGPAVLHAYNATNLAIELYNSSQNLSRDNPGGAVKMVPPVIAGGKVYVGAEYAVSVFGTSAFLSAPTIAPNGGTFANSVLVALVDATPGASIYYTLDGTTPTTSSALYTGQINLTNTALVRAIAAASGAVNSAVASASFVNTAATGSGTGLLGQYFANHTSASPFNGSPALVQTNATINFNWSTNGPGASVGTNNFTVLWTGCVQPQFDESYTFITTADDGVRLYVNGQLLVNDWVDKTNATAQSNSITLLSQQLYNIELDYYEKTSNSSISLSWGSPSTATAIVPQTQLYPFTNPPPSVVLTAPVGSATNCTAPASVTISAMADAPYNPVKTVSFYANSNLLGTTTNVPYTLTKTGLLAGNYALTAVAVDGSGLSSTSAPVNITVNAGSGQPYGLTNRPTTSAFFNMPTTVNGSLPPLLSMTGIFSNTPGMTPVNGLIPYAPNTPLWSDNASKTRYFAVPNDGGVITPDEQISFATTNSWTFPAGTVFVKNFFLTVNETNSGVPLRRLETRLLVRDINGQVYGVTYKWRADNSEADLLPDSLSENILITNAAGVRTQTWYYPSRADCLTCHTPVANYVLGVNTRQLNGNLLYPATGVSDNQLRTFNRLGLFNPAFNETNIAQYAKLSSLTNLAASLEERSRSYFDANCSQCHQPGGTGPTFDGRYDTPLANQNIVYGGLDPLSDNQAMVVPRDIWRSEMYQRAGSLSNAFKMPPLAKSLLDTNALAVIASWINSLPGTPALAPPLINPNGGSYVGDVKVSLQPPDTNASIYYTLDGSLPTTNSSLYSGTVDLLSNVTLTASAFETGYNNSFAAAAVFSIQPIQFTSVTYSKNLGIQFGVFGITGSNYVLQATTNFSSWTNLSTNLATTNPFILFDARASNYPSRFYRVKQQ
jgi:mono/diheme cytochrome c family protein